MTASDRVTALICSFAAIIVSIGITSMVISAQIQGTKRQVACADAGGSWSDGKCLIIGRRN